MSSISKPNTFSAGSTIVASEHNANFDTIYNDYNGNITNVNVSASASIAASKLNLTSIAQTIAMSNPINYAKGSNIASATTTDIGAATGNYVLITGTTTITGFGTVQAGTTRFVMFNDALTLTYNATSLILPTSANITTVAGDMAAFISEGSGNWRCLVYQRRDGSSLLSSIATQSDMETATSTTTLVTPGRTKYHPGVSKGWCVLDGTGTVSILESYNVSGIVDDGTGLYTVQWDTDFSTANYAIFATAYTGSSTSGFMCHVSAQAAGSCQIKVTENAAGATDVDKLYVLAFGDQA